MKPIQRHKTAIRRYDFSISMKALERHGFLDGNYSLFDYGCGLGDDLSALEERGIAASGWDPVYRSEAKVVNADIVNLGFVINVIEDPVERMDTLKKAFGLAEYLLSCSVMLGSDGIQGKFQSFGDGCLTSRNTFQKYFTQSEFKEYLQKHTGVDPVAVGPGIFFLFRKWEDREIFLLQRQMERVDVSTGLASVSHSKFKEDFSKNKLAREQKRQDLLVYLALSLFQGLKHQSLPEGIHREIRGVFPSFVSAKKESTDVLYSIADTRKIEDLCVAFFGNTKKGFLEEGHSYIFHSSYLDRMDPILRVYVGIALILYGDRELVDLIKIHFTSGKVTFLQYKDFHESPNPNLVLRVKVNLRNQKIDFFEYGGEYESQPLIEKERYLPDL